MTEETAKGNNPQLWDKLLANLDEKLQLGLLDLGEDRHQLEQFDFFVEVHRVLLVTVTPTPSTRCRARRALPARRARLAR